MAKYIASVHLSMDFEFELEAEDEDAASELLWEKIGYDGEDLIDYDYDIADAITSDYMDIDFRVV